MTKHPLTTSPLALLAWAMIPAAIAAAQPISIDNQIPRIDILTHTPDKHYQGHMVIRVRTTSQRQLDALLELTESVWSERVGVGLLDIQIQQTNLSAITKQGIAYDVIIDDLQQHADTQWQMVVEQERRDIQNRLDRTDDQTGQGVRVHDDAWFANYKQFADIITYFNNIATLRPDLASMADIGDSIEGRNIYALTITGPDTPGNLATDRPAILWHGTTHAREWVSPMTVSYLASKFVDSYDTDPRVADILDSTRLIIVPVTNPDGYQHTWDGYRYWRKNRRNNGNAIGVDINRNWGYQWGGQGSSNDPQSDIYAGTGPFSEPETDALRLLSESLGDKLAAHIDYHTYSQLILWPFGYANNATTPEPDRTFYDTLATDMSEVILGHSGVFYNPMQSVDLYPAAGDSSDWFYGTLGAKSLTFELRPSAVGLDGFDPLPEIILPTAQENYEASKLFVERTTQQVVFNIEPLDILHADTPTALTLVVSNGLANHDTTEPTVLMTRINAQGAYTQTPMSNLGDGFFGADLPLVTCGSTLEYYFQLTTSAGDVLTHPPAGSAEPISIIAQQFEVVHSDTMETDTGWIVGSPTDTATTGIWNRMDPQGNLPQPEDDHTPDGTDCWITDGNSGNSIGHYDVDGGATTLTSPMLDAIIAGDNAELIYHRWYSNDTGATPNDDSMLIELSNDNGNSWLTLEIVVENANAWVEKRFLISDLMTPTDQMRIRFIASDFGDGSIVEAAVDDLRIESRGCTSNPADLNNDGNLDFFDVSIFLAAFAAQDPIADFDLDGQWTFFDISAFLFAFSEG